MVRPRILLVLFVFGVGISRMYAQTAASSVPKPAEADLPAPGSEQTAATSKAASALPDAPQPEKKTSGEGLQGKQTKRILGVVPNFRAVGVDVHLPPQSTREKFKLMFDDSFDYSAFIYVGIVAGVSQGMGSYPEFHSGAPAYARYYWHTFADNVNGNFWVEFAMPTVTREDSRYYTLGKGNVLKRGGYAISRLLVTRTDTQSSSFNFSEIVGNGAGAAIGSLYYPSQERTWTKIGQRWLSEVAQDGFSFMVREFWPDINSRILHNHE